MIRAYIQPSLIGHVVNISLIRQHETDPAWPRHVLHFETRGEGDRAYLATLWEPLDPDGNLAAPTLTLDHESAIALLGALHSHYQGVDDSRMLRRDYDAERDRVDKLIGVLADVARGRTDV